MAFILTQGYYVFACDLCTFYFALVPLCLTVDSVICVCCRGLQKLHYDCSVVL